MLLGECYENGYGVEVDLSHAFQLYQSAYERGYAPAACALGVC